jgi:hypothetical protein
MSRHADEIDEKFQRIAKKMEAIEAMIAEIDEFLNPKYALDFDKEKYLGLGFLESAQWVAEILAKKMLKKMKDNEDGKFSGLLKMKSHWRIIGVRTCARFNRGEACCRGQWHTSYKKLDVVSDGRLVEQQQQRDVLRVHACTLCLEALGIISGHGLLDCPWIYEENWN